MTTRPPALAEWLMARSLCRDDRAAVLGDLCEEFATRRERCGIAEARHWYWRQVRRSLLPNLLRRFEQTSRPSYERPGRLDRIARAPDALAQDLRYAVRMLGKSRGFSAIAVVSLSIGIGVSTVLFSFANTLLFRPLHAANASELVQVFTSGFNGPSYGGSSYPDYEDFRDRGEIFSGLLAATRAHATLSDRDRPDVIAGAIVSPNYFDVLGLRPSRGRFFLPEDNRPSAEPVVVLSHDAWQRKFASDDSVVGTRVGLNGHAFTVIGVGPPRFAGTSLDTAADFFVPVMMQPIVSPGADVLGNRRARVFIILGRLKANVERREADARLRLVAAQLLLAYPDAWRDRRGQGRSVAVLPEVEARFAGTGPGAIAWIFSSVIAGIFVLLAVACVNVATVLLARATARRKEIAVRLALGASRARIVRQLLTECALLAAAGGVLGLLLAQWAAALFARFRPDEAPPFDLTLDYRVLAFGVAASIATIVLFGLAPALQTTRADVNAALTDKPRAVRLRRFRIGLRDALVVLQVGVSLALVVGAVLMFRSFQATRAMDPGFRRDGVLSVEIDLSTIGASRDAEARFYREAVRSVAALPSVERVALAALVPMDGRTRNEEIAIDNNGSEMLALPDINVVGPGYFALMDIPVVQGREFATTDREGAPTVAVVNEAMARRIGQGRALGRTFRSKARNVDVQIVGVIRDLHHRWFSEAPRPMVYFCADQAPFSGMTLHVRSAAPPAALGASVVRVLHDIDRAAGLAPPRTMAEHMEIVTQPQRLGGLAAAATGLVELALAVMALYGVIAFAAAQRTREIGLRIALGAPAGSVTRLIMRDGLALAMAGVALGVVASIAAAPLVVSDFLIGVSSADPLSYAAAAVLLLAVAAAASYVPARRASRMDPSVALRSD